MNEENEEAKKKEEKERDVKRVAYRKRELRKREEKTERRIIIQRKGESGKSRKKQVRNALWMSGKYWYGTEIVVKNREKFIGKKYNWK